MSVEINPGKPNFGETQWITLEDVNVEYLLDIFMAIDPNSDSVWAACTNFMQHLSWHKKRLTILKPKIEGLPDDHPFKPGCLFELSLLLSSVGNHAECKQLLTHVLKLERERGDVLLVAHILMDLSNINRQMDFPKEGIQQAKEALEIYEQLGHTTAQADCSIKLAWLLNSDNQFGAAEEAAFRAINLLSEKGEQFWVCQSHRALGEIYRSKGETKKAIHHYELALGITSSFNWHDLQFWINYELAVLFIGEGGFDDAHAHLEQAKLHTVNSARNLGLAIVLQAVVLHKQRKLEEAKSQALRAADIFENVGAAKDVEDCRIFVQRIQKELDRPVASDKSALNCELLQTMLLPARIDFSF